GSDSPEGYPPAGPCSPPGRSLPSPPADPAGAAPRHTGPPGQTMWGSAIPVLSCQAPCHSNRLVQYTLFRSAWQTVTECHFPFLWNYARISVSKEVRLCQYPVFAGWWRWWFWLFWRE